MEVVCSEAHFTGPRVIHAAGEEFAAPLIVINTGTSALIPPVPGLTEQISELVESVVPRPAGTPTHWRGAHGDLTPWNLRRSHRGTWLIDWEDAGWAPPGADDVYFRATIATMGRQAAHPLALADGQQEAARYWLDIVRSRPIAASETTLKARLETLLGAR